MSDKPPSLAERIAARKQAEAEARTKQKPSLIASPIVSREWLDNTTEAEVKALTQGQLGKPNAAAIGEYPPGSLKAVACRCSGTGIGSGRWEVLYEWVPI